MKKVLLIGDSIREGYDKYVKEILKDTCEVKVLPYHNYAGSKYEALHMENTLPKILPTEEEIKNAEKMLVLC